MVIDIIIVILLILAIITGIWKGFIAQLISIIAIILGVWLSCRFGSLVGNLLAEKISVDVNLMRIIAFIVIFVAVVLVLSWLGRLLEKVIKILLLGWLNRLLGVVFALLKYILIIGLLLMLFDTLNNDIHIISQEYLESSIFYYPFEHAVARFFPYLRDMFALL